MSAYIASRRQFLRRSLATASLPFIPHLAFGECPEDVRTAWYRAAKFGMFIHWGPYSLASVEASWPIMTPKPGGISEAEYVALHKRFNPVNYDPDSFIDLARAAGQQYMVFTTKHHDGFCMFDSAYTDYKITNTPYGKDIVKQLADACARRSMPLGLYYSPPDLHHPGFRDTSRPASETWHGQPERPEWPTYLQYMQLQLTELLTRYGDVKVIWFDGLDHQEKYDGRRVLDMIRTLQPATLVNDRIGVPGDFVTPEQFIPKVIPTKGMRAHGPGADLEKGSPLSAPRQADFQLWETCMTINDTWAYNAHDHHYKSAQDLIRALVEVVSRGGNFLLNVGPQPDGTIQAEFQERLRRVGDWLTVNGESIYGTTFGPIQGNAGFRTTAKDNVLFLHVFDWPSASLTITGVKPKVVSARLLSNNQRLVFQQSDSGLQITLPPQAPDKDVSVIALRML
ncbi:alpha-L-fucosidase [Granulicella mallensis]|uniref:alpha-L-fucosidase n=1 Tax=Granulicella mallensis TaxID=940614 RepID=A0A7W8EC71_9BACT|nr:alpha-L-fucosidase [Granulicella mallensis]MBB5066391.1 alpha-L-fucosidase [Granulicella mallensis]